MNDVKSPFCLVFLSLIMFFPFDLCFVVGSWICLLSCLVALPVICSS